MLSFLRRIHAQQSNHRHEFQQVRHQQSGHSSNDPLSQHRPNQDTFLAAARVLKTVISSTSLYTILISQPF